MTSTITDPNREKDILALCKAVLSISPNWYDDPNGPYTTTCPFCSSRKWEGGSHQDYGYMSQIIHSSKCAYLIAKDLSTGLL